MKYVLIKEMFKWLLGLYSLMDAFRRLRVHKTRLYRWEEEEEES